METTANMKNRVESAGSVEGTEGERKSDFRILAPLFVRLKRIIEAAGCVLQRSFCFQKIGKSAIIIGMSDTLPPSPWLAQLTQERAAFLLNGDAEADVAVIGAGIAGVSTTYQLLRHTHLKVVLVDAGRIAHGATGRNAGQLVSYFERPFPDIVKAFGLEMAVAGQLAVESAWDIVDDIRYDCKLETPLHICAGYAGLTSVEQIVGHLEEQHLRAQAGIEQEPMLIKVDPALIAQIPAHLRDYCTQVPQSVVMNALETEDTAFIAAEISKKGCMNSALFCEELVAHLANRFPERLSVVEHLPVHTVTLEKDGAVLHTNSHTIHAKNVVLCTNGFENFTIENKAGDAVDASFHASISGRIGYMAAYMDEPNQVPIAISYYRSDMDGEPYHYLTRRPYEKGNTTGSLICIGGPERHLPDSADYDPLVPFPADIEEELDRQLRYSYHDLPPHAAQLFLWQGLMGYTPNQIRRIGFEPKNNVLLYNLGCNGVGILPSIYGGKRIMQLIAGIDLPPSIFDPVFGNR